MRWFQGEESKEKAAEDFALQLAGLADIYVNDALVMATTCLDLLHHPLSAILCRFPHAAGDHNLDRVLNPERPFLLLSQAEYDTKIRPLYAIYEKVDRLILGGVIYNTYLCAKYHVRIKGCLMKTSSLPGTVEKDKHGKDHRASRLVESTCRTAGRGQIPDHLRQGLCPGRSYGYILDIDPASFEDSAFQIPLPWKNNLRQRCHGITPHFTAGSQALDHTIDRNGIAMKMYGGGDTSRSSRICARTVSVGDGQCQYYFFTAGTV